MKADMLKDKRVGLVASSFDLLHAGHCIMLEDAKNQCDYLVAALQTDPTVDRPDKNKPVQSIEERWIALNSNKHIDEILIYRTEENLYNLIRLVQPDIRILGSDWVGKDFTGKDLTNEVYFHNRDHDYSTSSLRRRVHIEELKNSK